MQPADGPANLGKPAYLLPVNTIKTNSNGVASFKDASTLAIGTHNVEITSNDKNYNIHIS